MDLQVSFDPRVVAGATVTLAGGLAAIWERVRRKSKREEKEERIRLRELSRVQMALARSVIRDAASQRIQMLAFEEDLTPAEKRRMAQEIYARMEDEMRELPSSDLGSEE